MLKMGLLLWICLGLPISAVWACSYAYQYSLFPQAILGDSLYYFELDLERYVLRPEDKLFRRNHRFDASSEQGEQAIETRWRGKIRVKALDLNHLDTLGVLHYETAYIDLSDEQYFRALEPYWLEARAALEGVDKGLVWLNLPSLAYCYYERNCVFFEREIDEETGKLRCISSDFPPYEFWLPSWLQGRLAAGLSSAADMDMALKEWAKAWKTYSIRRYVLGGGRELLVYTLGRGQRRFYQAKTPSGLWQSPDLTEGGWYLEGNDVLFHGQRVDGLQYLQKNLDD